MSEPVTFGIVVAFVAGVLSFLSPCVLPLVPSYIGFLTGMTLPEIGTRRRAALLHALLFVLGFSLVFILLGATATALGRALGYYQVWLQRAGGVLIILFGLLCLGVLSARPLLSEHRMQLEQKPLGYLGSAVVGMAFAAGWTPCIGPVLGGILGLAATSTDVTRGMLLLAVYSAGLALPFLLAAIAVESFLGWVQRFRRVLPWVMRLSGLLLILVGGLLVTGQFTRLAGWLQGLTPDILREQL
ncbi:MAG TPA: cytochrome c biogenesis protein CcdA [Gemmatimonadales bacterium]|nr:cytochrome c biogenesis protein CcdA [Gemmatimonadales bacterium]